MAKLSRKKFGIGGVLVLVIMLWSFHSLSLTSNHFGQMLCSDCHLSSQPNVNDREAVLLINNQEVLCGRCHADAIKTSHPSGLIPSQLPPRIYPLDWKGEMTCSTCHDVHSRKKGLMRADKTGKEHCLACHEESFFAQMIDKGTSLVTTFDDSSVPVEVRENLDTFTQKCLSCHEKQTKAFLVSLNKFSVLQHSSSSMSHPIGRSYAQAENYGGYRPMAQLDNKIILPEGKLSCLSCHKNYTSEHGKLIESTQGSRLCFLCHDI